MGHHIDLMIKHMSTRSVWRAAYASAIHDIYNPQEISGSTTETSSITISTTTIMNLDIFGRKFHRLRQLLLQWIM